MEVPAVHSGGYRRIHDGGGGRIIAVDGVFCNAGEIRVQYRGVRPGELDSACGARNVIVGQHRGAVMDFNSIFSAEDGVV